MDRVVERETLKREALLLRAQHFQELLMSSLLGRTKPALINASITGNFSSAPFSSSLPPNQQPRLSPEEIKQKAKVLLRLLEMSDLPKCKYTGRGSLSLSLSRSSSSSATVSKSHRSHRPRKKKRRRGEKKKLDAALVGETLSSDDSDDILSESSDDEAYYSEIDRFLSKEGIDVRRIGEDVFGTSPDQARPLKGDFRTASVLANLGLNLQSVSSMSLQSQRDLSRGWFESYFGARSQEWGRDITRPYNQAKTSSMMYSEPSESKEANSTRPHPLFQTAFYPSQVQNLPFTSQNTLSIATNSRHPLNKQLSMHRVKRAHGLQPKSQIRLRFGRLNRPMLDWTRSFDGSGLSLQFEQYPIETSTISVPFQKDSGCAPKY